MINAYDKALSLLSMREHTAKEIKDKLLRKGYNKEETEAAVSRLLDEDAISEERFAEVFIRSRMRRNPEGKPILLMRLREKGCPDSISRKALDEYWDNYSFMPYLSDCFKSLSVRRGSDYAISVLIRKGFTMNEIREAEAFSGD